MYFTNRVRLATSYVLGNPYISLFPQAAAIEITNHCNLSCRMCPHDKMTRKQGVMSYDLFCKIIDDLKGKTEIVYLFGAGESLLVDNFFEYAAYAIRSGMTTCLSTNVTMINKDVAGKLIDSGIDFIILSVDGSSPETYNNIRVGADFDSTIEKCKSLLQAKLKKRAKTDITIQFIVMEENVHEQESLRKHFSEEENKKAINHFRLKPLIESYAKGVDNISHTCPCYFLWNFIFITWNGNVSICCMDANASYVIGDLKKNTVRNIWNGKEIQKLRQLHLNLEHNSIPICKTCTFPEKRYFSKLTVLGGMFINAWMQRKITPYFERYYILKDKGR